MAVKTKVVPENPLIIRCHRLMEAFAKSDDERDYYLDRTEGFLVYLDLDKSQEELDDLEKELASNTEKYCPIPKLTFYEIKKIMEGFVNEKVYDIDTKEKLLDIIQSKEARENFLEFIYDHHSELEKWQQYYQERFRVRIIEWLRNNHFDFVFEEDLELTKSMVEKLKMHTFSPKVGKDIASARKILAAKAKTYYSNEALNPRPKRGRPPKQVVKVETEPQFSGDIYITVPKAVKSFLFTPDYHGQASIFTFSGKFASEADLLAHRRQQLQSQENLELQNLNQKLQTIRTLSSQWMGHREVEEKPIVVTKNARFLNGDIIAPKASVAVTGDHDLDLPKKGSIVRKSKPLVVSSKKAESEKVKVVKKAAVVKPKAVKIKPVKEKATVKVAKPSVKAKVRNTADTKARLRKLPAAKAPVQKKVASKPVAKKPALKKPAVRLLRRAKKK